MKKIVNFIKHHTFTLSAYVVIGSLILKSLSLIVKVKKKQVLLCSFGGKRYDDSPKVLYDYMIDHPSFKDYEFIWAFTDPDLFEIPKGKKISINSLKYFWVAINSGIWISNVSIERGLRFKTSENYYINTWHGTPLKKICSEANSSSIDIDPKGMDLMCCQSEFDKKIFSRLFDIHEDNILMVDLPRNDSLLKYRVDDCIRIKQSLGIELSKKVILYAPTFREYDVENNKFILSKYIDFEKWSLELGQEYVILFRGHYLISQSLSLKTSSHVKDVSGYPILNDLMVISDILVSDYSSIFFDFSILEKPMLCYAYDYEMYSRKRGMYFDIRNELLTVYNEMQLLKVLRNLNNEELREKSKQFKIKYAPNPGKSSEKLINEFLKRDL